MRGDAECFGRAPYDSSVSREWCIVVRPTPSATSDDVELIRLALEMRTPPFDVTEDSGDFVVYVDSPHSVRRAEKAVLRTLAQSDVAATVVRPFPLGQWTGDDTGYRFVKWFEEGTDGEAEPAVSPEEITFAISLAPVSAFGWRALTTELALRGRTKIGENAHVVEVGARDLEDANSLVDLLRERSLIRAATITKLGWLRRWRVRQHLLGNYAPVERDPAQAP